MACWKTEGDGFTEKRGWVGVGGQSKGENVCGVGVVKKG